MVKVDELLNTIDNNQNLSLEIKENIKELINIYTSNTTNIDFETINTNIANLKIEATSKYLVSEPLKYNKTDETIYINTSEIEKEYDFKFLLMRELILMQTYKNDIGKLRKDQFNPIYEGYASICANTLVGNDSPHNLYEDEIISVNLLSQIVGFESIEELFVNNNSQLLIDNLSKTGNTIDDINELINIMNYNITARNNPRGKSMLSNIQIKLMNMFANKKDLTTEEIEKFSSLLYGNNNVFDSDKYENLNQVYDNYNEITSNLTLEQPATSKTR
ncbi:MAG: hypothetical protein PHW32_00265 [Bacilli bacterium]|nr:hypothetical protein [Bacilli bacterium]MDD4282408.1 hypothetical protein [Bacilli bacterium]MDD4718442.1 hypothetical protein [Bacilli bacterium]